MDVRTPRPDRPDGTSEDDGGSPLAPLDDASLSFYTIGQVAELLDVAQPALRRLDGLDIVRPDRSEGGQRRYSREEVHRLREVLDLTDNGVTLAGVRIVLELRQRVSELEAEVAQLRRTLARHLECGRQPPRSTDATAQD
ncbi:MerR family transcriptional regulator [Microbacterium soli]|uniref:Helix-turn-helix domain-containing protein n=1 Tax=Microbacterium soli TaxID=446075 RepID=A0ABP7MPW2_9MICO